MKIVIATATELEIAPLLHYMDESGFKKNFFEYVIGEHSIFPLTTGIGSMKMAFGLATYPAIKEVNLVINVGLAGAFNADLSLGQVVEVTQDRIIDLGSEQQSGELLSVYDLNLENKDLFPFKDGWLINDKSKIDTGLKKVSSASANMVSGSKDTIATRQGIANVETMEGYGFAYACKCLDVNYIQIRGISNYVEPRNRDNWKIHEAVEASNAAVLQLIKSL